MRKLFLFFFVFIFPFSVFSAHIELGPYADFYVSTVGNDNWTGKLAEPNAAKTDGPFATITRAREAVRLIKKDCYRNIYVLIRGGEYLLSETETFTPAIMIPIRLFTWLIPARIRCFHPMWKSPDGNQPKQ
jgi:hypothetical protein